MYNEADRYTFTNNRGVRANARYIEMLVGAYTLNEPVSVERGKSVMLTTAPSTDTDGYAYTGVPGTACVITRGGNCNGSMITNLDTSNLVLKHITLDGGNREVDCDGGIVNNARTSAVLTIRDGATLRNSIVKGNGGAVNAIAGTTVELISGVITGNSVSANGNGAGLYLAAGSNLKLSGNPSFSDNFGGATMPPDATNGATPYLIARQDIYLSESQENPASIKVTGNLSGEPGSIWIWAEHEPHYKMLKPFATVSDGVRLDEAAYKIFRNARPDSLTDCGGDYLTGQTGDNPRWIYWTGGTTRTVILRKTNDSFVPLKGAKFEMYKYDMSLVSGELDSGDKGVFFTGSLPYGAYYLQESKAPENLENYDYSSNAGKWFCVIVDDKGVWMSQKGYKTNAGDEADRASAIKDARDVRAAAHKVGNSP